MFSLFIIVVCMSAIPLAGSTPAFTRQTGAACRACHFQDMRSLNAYGRKFLQNSFHESKQMQRERREMESRAKQGGKKDGEVQRKQR